MDILLTGVSSFTGSWFATTLARAGHRVVGTLRRPAADYPELTLDRLEMCRLAGVTFAEGIEYGSPELIALAGQGWDAIGYHAADVSDYRSAAFDPVAALDRNTRGAAALCARAAQAGVGKLIVTGSVFEPAVGRGDDADRAVTPYGLSKALTWELMRFRAHEAGLSIAHFIVANPFGPLEQDRFCTYLARSWLAGDVPEVRAPDYVRDNIPVDKLATAYAAFVAGSEVRCAPAGYQESQGAFTQRFAHEIGPRLGVPAPFRLCRQTDFSEPLVRTATDTIELPWSERDFWDSLAADYRRRLAPAA